MTPTEAAKEIYESLRDAGADLLGGRGMIMLELAFSRFRDAVRSEPRWVFVFRTPEPDAELVGVYSSRELAEAERTRQLDEWNERIRKYCASSGKPFCPMSPDAVGAIDGVEIDAKV